LVFPVCPVPSGSIKSTQHSSISILQKFELFDDYWKPKILTEFNGQLLKIAKLKGSFVWHNHPKEDELFHIIKGELVIKYQESEIVLKEGDIHVVPKGIDHLPMAKEECWVLLIEPEGTGHTGNTKHERTVSEDEQEWI
jgi:mannose-6-phosphate isomerase-like protein (cupin superfamily)